MVDKEPSLTYVSQTRKFIVIFSNGERDFVSLVFKWNQQKKRQNTKLYANAKVIRINVLQVNGADFN